ncbi:unnamed protein product [Didymodactylos carnosus]|uniref:Uncharacterized protein n=1 Tax=Didymodactylos carnosus TaxID=1234261 RepID=A0A815P8J7_9BILA|nr:unnamed protein product [Didymodactylos carnosus]CAF1560487.1 unnamed protein product [Didymodactylos carnosus]CAF4320479.1 unnamed protein product [Didymodactylos carnosus]CAF4352040.1 unnamed protein product [Didymodactylos carnosus]
MSSTKSYEWKMLAFGRSPQIAETAEKHLHSLGYKNARVIALENNQENDQRLIKLLKEEEWDGVSIGGVINGHRKDIPQEEETFHFFNHLLNLIHENASSKTKIVLIGNPSDIESSYKRVLGGDEKNNID